MDAARVTFVLLSFVSFAVGVSCATSEGSEDGDAPLPSRSYADGGKEAGPDATGDPSFDGGGIITGPPTDADSPPPIDADSPPPPCDLAKPFGTPVAITELNTADQDIVSDVSPDELTMFIATTHAVSAGVQLFKSTRASKTAAWSSPVQLFPQGSWDNWGVTVSGNTAIVSSDRSGNSELYVATRSTPASAFGTLTLVTALNSTTPEEGPRWSADGKRFYFDSRRAGTRDIFTAPFDNGTFGPVTALAEINTSALEAAPVLSADELTLYFVSDRETPSGDIFVATRASKTSAFGTAVLAPNINSSGEDAAGAVSADGCTLYLSSTRLGTYDIYVAKRPN